MPPKQAIQASIPATPEPLADLVLSGIAYFILIHTLSLALGTIIRVLIPALWTLHKISCALSEWRNAIIWYVFLSLWAARFVLRWRGHLACAWGCFACILRWLSPLSPEPFGCCLVCWKGVRGERLGGEEQEHDQHDRRQSPRLTLSKPLPTSPASMQDEKGFTEHIGNEVALPVPPLSYPTSPATKQDEKRFADKIGNKIALPKFSLTDEERRAQREIGIFR